MGQKIENITLEIMDTTIQAGILPKLRKIQPLETAIAKTHVLKILLRAACDIGILEYKKYETLELSLHEIGKMLGGWKRSLL